MTRLSVILPNRPDAQFSEIVEAATRDEVLKALPERAIRQSWRRWARLWRRETAYLNCRTILKMRLLLFSMRATQVLTQKASRDSKRPSLKGKKLHASIAHRLSAIEETDDFFIEMDVLNRAPIRAYLAQWSLRGSFVEARSRIEGWQISKRSS